MNKEITLTRKELRIIARNDNVAEMVKWIIADKRDFKVSRNNFVGSHPCHADQYTIKSDYQSPSVRNCKTDNSINPPTCGGKSDERILIEKIHQKLYQEDNENEIR